MAPFACASFKLGCGGGETSLRGHYGEDLKASHLAKTEPPPAVWPLVLGLFTAPGAGLMLDIHYIGWLSGRLLKGLPPQRFMRETHMFMEEILQNLSFKFKEATIVQTVKESCVTANT